MNPIYPCIWLDKQAEEAARFYSEVFGEGVITSSSPVVASLELSGQRFMLLNGGPQFTPNPSISFYVMVETEAELELAWQKLTENGQVMMALDTYPWSKKYGWVQDRYGISWQLTLGKIADMGQKFTPAFMFVGEQFGRAEEAIRFYSAVFRDSATHLLARYDDSDEVQGGKVMHSQFDLLGRRFIAMDSGFAHQFSFTEGLSLVIDCDSQEEIDYYWDKLTEGGEESQCGWLKDRFGLSWQVAPAILGELMSDPARAGRVTEAFLRMKKFDIRQLVEA